jgi:fatty-acyl-CoA synthase
LPVDVRSRGNKESKENTMAKLTVAYDSGTATTELAGSTIGEALQAVVDSQPQRMALISRHQEIRWTWQHLGEEVERAALGLIAVGIKRGDRVGIWSPNCAEWTVLQLACASVGAIIVNINPAYRPAELAFALGQSGVRLLVTAESFRTSQYLSMLSGVRSGLAALERVVTIGRRRAEKPDDLLWPELLAAGHGVAGGALYDRQASLDRDDPINIQYTSGTTGRPKGATLTHHNILNNARAVVQTLRYTPEDRVCIPVPLYHCFGMGIGNLGCLAAGGATMVYPSPTFDPAATLQAIAGERCTSIYGVPTMFIAQLEEPGFAQFDLTSLRTGLMGGAPCPVEIMKRVMTDMHARELCIIYGMTETAPVSFMTRPEDDLQRRVATVGRVMPHSEAKVIDPSTGRTVPVGNSGEICTRGYLVMRGYWENPQATAEAIDDAGWMHTGDLGAMDAEGYLQIVGRIKDMVIRGGENLYPREIEEVLFQHPAIASVQVVGVPDARLGEELMAWVVLRDDAQVSVDELREFCHDRVAHFKVPRYFRFVDEFPMTVTGKVQKYRLREIAIEELGLKDAASTRTA